MLVIFATKITRPGPARIAKLSERVVLSRSLPAHETVGAIVGGIIGLSIGVPLGGLLGVGQLTGAVFGAAISGLGGVMLVQWKPWEGENPARVGVTWLWAKTQQRTLICPGSGFPPELDEESMETACSVCSLFVEADAEELAPIHEWKRRLYLGMAPIRTPETGIVRLVQGNVPVR